MQLDTEVGDKSGRMGRPGSSFVLDPEFYVQTWRDVREAGIDPLHHYEEHGRRERRQCCESQMLSDIAAVEASGVLARAAAQGEWDGRSARSRLVDFFDGVRPMKSFSADLTLNYYPRTLVEGEHPFAFYCRHAGRPWCFAKIEDAEHQVHLVRSSSLFDPDYVLSQMAPELRHLDPALYYLTEGFRARIDPSARFSTRAYVLEYPDIHSGQLNPLLHYEQNGRSEGRRGLGRRDAFIQPGGQAFRPEYPTLLICSNEAGRSGAPLVGLNLARHLARRYNVISAFLRNGPLMSNFAELSAAVAVCGDGPSAGVTLVEELKSRYALRAAVLNSVEGTRIIAALKGSGVPVISLIHDFAQYVAPFDLMARTMTMSDRTIFPAEIVKAAALRELAQNGFASETIRNVEVRPQGRSTLPPADTGREVHLTAALAKPREPHEITVVGAGFVQPRKGVDLFIDAARILKDELGVKCRFIWVGGGYAPQTDLLTSVYLADQIRASGLENTVSFMSELQDLSPVWAAADAFFVSSRLDPFPNVALDALAEGLPVVCFQQATGIAELAERLPDRVIAVAYNDTRAAASAIAGGAAAGRRTVDDRLRAMLSFDLYAEDVARQVEAAVREASIVRSLVDEAARADVDPMLLYDDLPGWAPLVELCGSVRGLYEAASRAALNGVRLGRLRHGRTTALPEPAAVKVMAGDAGHAWSDDDYDREMIARSGPISAVLVSESSADILDLAKLAFKNADVGRFIILGGGISEFDLNPLAMVTGREAIFHLQPGDPVDCAANFISQSDCLVIAGGNPGADWKEAAGRLARLRPKHGCGVALSAASGRDVRPKPTLEARMSPPLINFDRRLFNESVCCIYGCINAEIASILKALSSSHSSFPQTIWDALTASSSLLTRGWVLDEPSSYASLRGYDLLTGREPILLGQAPSEAHT